MLPSRSFNVTKHRDAYAPISRETGEVAKVVALD